MMKTVENCWVMNFATSTENFVSLLKAENEWFNAIGDFGLSDLSKKAVAEFCLKKASRFVLTKVFAIKKLVKTLTSQGVIPSVKVKFDYFKKGHAYMLDKGELHFCKDFIFSDSYEKNVAMAMHEIAHAILLKHSSYASLTAINAEFLDIIKTPSQIVITPVEFYANLITARLLESGMENAEDEKRVAFLKEEADFLKRKMRSAIKSL